MSGKLLQATMSAGSQSPQERELELRRQLGIPDDARHVLVFAESSHWDPNWLLTSEEYFERFVRHNLDSAIEELNREPRRVFSVECVFFLRKYWDDRAEQRETIRALVNERRLRLSSSGVTTADTLLPYPEAILRDFLLGQEWLRTEGMRQEPTVAYFPDSFGCSHALPSLLNAAGFDRAGITRIDGMLFPGCDFPLGSHFRGEGSSAWILMDKEKTLDFIWRDSDGGEILCHWNAYSYGQGDLLAQSGLSRVYLFPIAIPNRSDWNVTRRIHRFAKDLIPYARTPYLFCPIGYDFVEPIPDLVALLDRYNERHYPKTGIWTVNAGIDDYLSLVDCCRDRLPVLDLDPNPYWTGFYTSRPSLKMRCHDLVDALILAEQLQLQSEDSGTTDGIQGDLKDAWWTAVVSNHHDFITGTSTDRVVRTEQEPWLARAAEVATAAISRLDEADPPRRNVGSSRRRIDTPEWHASDGVIEIHTPSYNVEVAEEAGGCIVRAWEPGSDRVLLWGPSVDLVSYYDSGGLWRMGHEFTGGVLRELDRGSRQRVPTEVREQEGGVELTSTVHLDGVSLTRRMWFFSESPAIRLQIQGRAATRRTVTLRLEASIEPTCLEMDEPGGVVSRPTEKKYKPTFWPLQTFVHLRSGDDCPGLAVLFHRPGAAACRLGGRLEVVSHRNAKRERAFGFLGFPGLPVTGHERSSHSTDFAILFTSKGDWEANGLALAARRATGSWVGEQTSRARFDELVESQIETDPQDVFVTATKLASRGSGWIIRLSGPGQQGTSVKVRLLQRAVSAAYLCDARERDLEPLDVRDGTVHLAMPGSIATLRIVTS